MYSTSSSSTTGTTELMELAHHEPGGKLIDEMLLSTRSSPFVLQARNRKGLLQIEKELWLFLVVERRSIILMLCRHLTTRIAWLDKQKQARNIWTRPAVT
jgi:hypothetical protein